MLIIIEIGDKKGVQARAQDYFQGGGGEDIFKIFFSRKIIYIYKEKKGKKNCPSKKHLNKFKSKISVIQA